MPRSLAARLAVASLCVLPILLATSSYLLDVAFRRSVLSGEEEQLKTQVYLLLGEMEFDKKQLLMPEAFQEPRLNQIDSGLYGWISSTSEKELWRSPSARLLELNSDPLQQTPIEPGTTQFTTIDSNVGTLFAFIFDVSWESVSGNEMLLRISTLHSHERADAEIAAYRSQLWRWLALLTVLIVSAQTLILKWSLRPLQKLSRDLEAVESGQNSQLEGAYPSEIQHVTDNFNRVLHSEKNQRERYRHTLNDLAHSLKTPLAVIQSQLSLEEDSEKTSHVINDQVARMNQIVSHQLARAAHSNNSIPGQAILVESVVRRLCESLKKVYFEKQTRVEIDVAANTFFNSDESDLMELLGNLIDNGFKYGKSWLGVKAHNQGSLLTVEVSDDGPGIPQDRRSLVLQRGARADTATTGQGIGLAVAIDIVSSYKGSLKIEESVRGGANIIIELPLK